MDFEATFAAIYSFLFESFAGIGVLVGACLVISIIVAAILEVKTRKTYVDRGNREDDTEFFEED